MEQAVLNAIYYKHTSTIDGGLRISFDCAENMADEINKVFRMRDRGLYLVVMTEEQFNSTKETKFKKKSAQ